MGDKLLFFKNFVTNPSTIGSVVPSSPFLVNDLLAGGDFDKARIVVEFGPGTGVFTDEILKRLHPDAKFMCIELMPAFVETLRARYTDPRMILIQGSAADVVRHLADHGFDHADYIVSGLPFTSLPDEIRHQILDGTAKALNQGGRFLLYQYSKFLMGHLNRYFSAIQVRWTAINIPPAFSFYCSNLPVETPVDATVEKGVGAKTAGIPA